MTKIDNKSGFEWAPEDRVDAIDTPRVFATLIQNDRVSDDAAPMISSLLEDAKFWEDPGTAIRNVSSWSAQEFVNDVAHWLDANPDHPQKRNVADMFVVLQKYAALER